jgi:DNA helicase HerA-like ATPase
VASVSKVIRIGDVEFDAQQYAINGTGVLGIKKSGKSWLAKTVAEQMLIAGIPIIVFDIHKSGAFAETMAGKGTYTIIKDEG